MINARFSATLSCKFYAAIFTCLLLRKKKKRREISRLKRNTCIYLLCILIVENREICEPSLIEELNKLWTRALYSLSCYNFSSLLTKKRHTHIYIYIYIWYNSDEIKGVRRRRRCARDTNGSRHRVDACSRCMTLINREATAMQLSRQRELCTYYKVRIGEGTGMRDSEGGPLQIHGKTGSWKGRCWNMQTRWSNVTERNVDNQVGASCVKL